nr:hypothetical protein GCM10020092_088580 [Actinoplanes digitatis]
MLHRHLLETAYDADINEDHSKAAKLLDHEYPDISDWPGYFRRSGMYSGDMYNDFAGDGLADLLGDALSEPELRLFFFQTSQQWACATGDATEAWRTERKGWRHSKSA